MFIDFGDTIMIIIDLQDKLLKIIPDHDRLIHNIYSLAKTLESTGTPIILTKQVKLGEIVDKFKEFVNKYPVIEKKTFSCFGNEDFVKVLESTKRNTLILTGIETHICVLQTAIDALEKEYNVIIPYDAVASQIKDDHEWALRSLEKKGVIILPSESIIYYILRSPDHSFFKEALRLVKERRKKYSI